VTEDIPVGLLMMSWFGPISVLYVLPYSGSPNNLLWLYLWICWEVHTSQISQ